jgi:hypothetical protein
MAYQEDRRGIVTLITDVIGDVTELFQTEIRLVRAEITGNVSRLANSAGLVGGAAMVGLAALFVLLQAVVMWLAYLGMPPHWGFTLVGFITAIVAYVMLRRGLDDLKSAKLVPDRSIDQLKADLATMKEHV